MERETGGQRCATTPMMHEWLFLLFRASASPEGRGGGYEVGRALEETKLRGCRTGEREEKTHEAITDIIWFSLCKWGTNLTENRPLICFSLCSFYTHTLSIATILLKTWRWEYCRDAAVLWNHLKMGGGWSAKVRVNSEFGTSLW